MFIISQVCLLKEGSKPNTVYGLNQFGLSTLITTVTFNSEDLAFPLSSHIL